MTSILAGLVSVLIYKVAIDAAMVDLSVVAAVLLGISVAVYGICLQILTADIIGKLSERRPITFDDIDHAQYKMWGVGLLLLAAHCVTGRLIVFGFSKKLSMSLTFVSSGYYSSGRSNEAIFYLVLAVPFALFLRIAFSFVGRLLSEMRKVAEERA